VNASAVQILPQFLRCLCFYTSGALTINSSTPTLTGNLNEHPISDIAHSFPDEDRQGMPNCNIWFLQDSTPPHYGVDVHLFLNNIFPSRWIGRRGSIEWPAKSPDLSPLDFFLCGHLKIKIYKEKPQNLQDLETKLQGMFSLDI
jgi:hypothetical protein